MAGDFSDEEWDVSDDQWHLLEHNAILSTQQKANGLDVVRRRPAKSNSGNLSSTQRIETPSDQNPGLRPNHAINEESFEAPSLDEDGIPLVVEQKPRLYPLARRPNEASQREQFRVNRFAQKNIPQPQYRPPTRTIPHQAYQNYQAQQDSQYGRPIQQKLSGSAQQPAQQLQNNNMEAEALRAELEQLRKERDLATQDLNHVTAELNTAKGEISVVRSKNTNEVKTAERRMSILKKQMQDEAAKYQATLLSKEAAYNQLITDKNFLKHELDEQTRKVQALQRQTKEKPQQDKLNSPRKGQASKLRDGFDDDEVMLMSPGRSPAKNRSSKPSTPTKKRKQTALLDDGPALVLRLSGDDEQAGERQEQSGPKPTIEPQPRRDHEAERHLQFVKDVLAFCPKMGQRTIVEILVEYAYPSESGRPLSSILLAETSALRGKRLPADMLHIFTKLLERCHKEAYYKPTAPLLAAVDHILNIDPTIIDDEVVTTLLPPLQALATLNSFRRFLTADRNRVWDEDHPKPTLEPDVDTTACLNVLLVVACLVIDEPELIKLFWRSMEVDSTLVQLTPSQPTKNIEIMFELLSTSILETTFGNINIHDLEEQAKIETFIVDRICFWLFDQVRLKVPEQKSTRSTRGIVNVQPPEPEPRLSREGTCKFRLKALSLLTQLIMTSIPHPHKANVETHHGTSLALNHTNLLARLIRCLYDEVNNVYAGYPDTHSLHADLVNRATTLIHHILLSPQATATDSTFSLPQALSKTLVGIHKFRVVMTRLVHREGVPGGLDVGITEETQRLALDVLEEYVTPDEAEQLTEVFGSMVVAREDEDEEMAEVEAEVMVGVEQ